MFPKASNDKAPEYERMLQLPINITHVISIYTVLLFTIANCICPYFSCLCPRPCFTGSGSHAFLLNCLVSHPFISSGFLLQCTVVTLSKLITKKLNV